MNDPGLDEPINDASDQVKDAYKNGEDSNEEEEETDSTFAARWWIASTAFPLMAGTFGPMANAFSICALVENWRVDISAPGQVEEHGTDINDPKWLIAVNAVSLVCALIANMSLLLNMARRLSFAIAQPITILGFWFASVLLIALIAVASHDFHAPGVRNQALTQAYYYAIFAAGLYQIISYLMCVTAYGAFKKHYSKEFKLTVAQRTLMLQTISFLMYQLLGALVFSKVEGWKFLDAVYWADFTTLTIGIGADYVPSTHLGRSLLFPFAIGGIITLGLVIGSIRSLVLDRGKKKLSVRVTEKTRQKLIKKVNKSLENRNTKPSTAMGVDKNVANALAVKPEQGEMDEVKRRRLEFEAMRRVQEVASEKRKYVSLGISTFAFAFLWMVGAFVFMKTERNQNWSYFQALYFSYTSLLTIGYGDFQPISNSGKPFFVFWSLLAIPTLTILISDMGDTVVKFIKDATIWLGEITVLPSDEGSVAERLKYGLYKGTGGKIDIDSISGDVEQGQINKPSSEDDNSAEEEDDPELNPGVPHLFTRHKEKRKQRQKKKNVERLATDFEEIEELNESIAEQKGDRSAQDSHHYRRLLISQIRQVYSDTLKSKPKQYTYPEWANFLKLLGEDEADASLHRRAVARKQSDADREGESSTINSKRGEETDFEDNGKQKHQVGKGQWSWMGNQSPLMSQKDESQWLLDRLFERLEESLKEEVDSKKIGPVHRGDVEDKSQIQKKEDASAGGNRDDKEE